MGSKQKKIGAGAATGNIGYWVGIGVDLGVAAVDRLLAAAHVDGMMRFDYT
jgi:hypothetical protein